MLSMDIEGATAAVDLGCIYHSIYTVFLGGTDPRFLGVSKVMNMHHIDFAFERRMKKVDFLCGDFHWKKLWHLDPEPLYKYVGPALRGDEQSVAPFREAFMEA
jgi:CelD/BcsL family acetyltransferase involved in cellulose biosynthesis